MQRRYILLVIVAASLTCGAGPAAAAIADSRNDRHVCSGGGVAADRNQNDGLLWLWVPSPHGTGLYRQGARYAAEHSRQGPKVCCGRAQSHSAGLCLVRSPGGQGSRHLQARRQCGFPGFRRRAQFRLLGYDAQRHQPAAGVAALGHLRHHTVGNPRYRGNILVGQLPHNTAVIVERKSGTKWIVDMWPTAYGQVPDVMPLAKWLEEK